MTSETPGTPALILDCNVTDKSDVHLQEPATLGAHVYINYLSSPKIHPVSKQTTNHELQQGKSQPDVFISCALAAIRSHLYRTLTCILKLYPKAGKKSTHPHSTLHSCSFTSVPFDKLQPAPGF